MEFSPSRLEHSALRAAMCVFLTQDTGFVCMFAAEREQLHSLDVFRILQILIEFCVVK